MNDIIGPVVWAGGALFVIFAIWHSPELLDLIPTRGGALHWTGS
jgi:hypothetical protein